MIVVSYGNHAHIVIALHQCADQGKLIGIHVLGLVNDENAFCDFPLFDLTVCNHPGSVMDHIFYAFKTSNLTEKIEAVGMEGLDLHKVRCISDQGHQPFFEFGCRSTGKGKHQKLLMLDILQKEQGGQLMHKHSCFSASGTCRHHNISGVCVIDNL